MARSAETRARVERSAAKPDLGQFGETYIADHADYDEHLADAGAVEQSSAEIYVSTPAETAIATINTPIKAAGTTTLVTDPTAVNFTMPANNRLTYGGTETILAAVSATISMTAAGNNKQICFYVAKNGEVIESSEVTRFVGTGADIGALALQSLVELDTDDYVEVWIENETDAVNATMAHMSMLVHAIN